MLPTCDECGRSLGDGSGDGCDTCDEFAANQYAINEEKEEDS